MNERPAQQPVRPSMLRDIFVQAVGSALGVGLVAVVGIAYGFIDVRAPDQWVRGTLAAVTYVGLAVAPPLLIAPQLRLAIPSRWRLALAAFFFMVGIASVVVINL